MKQLEDAAAWCPHCDNKLVILVTQLYRNDTWLVEYHCRKWNFDSDVCEEGIVMLMEVKN